MTLVLLLIRSHRSLLELCDQRRIGFVEMRERDVCGSVELAGGDVEKAVGKVLVEGRLGVEATVALLKGDVVHQAFVQDVLIPADAVHLGLRVVVEPDRSG